MGRESRLGTLLGKVACCLSLSDEEEQEVHELIAGATIGDEVCWLCRLYGADDAAIKGLGLCKSHAFYALVTGK